MDIHNSVTGVHNSIQNIRNWLMYSMNVSNDGYPKFITIMDRVTWGKTPVGAKRLSRLSHIWRNKRTFW